MNKALVIRTSGDAQLAGAIVDGMLHEELERLRAENARLTAELGVLKARDATMWQGRIEKNRRVYRVRRKPRWAQRILRAWAGLTLGVRA